MSCLSKDNVRAYKDMLNNKHIQHMKEYKQHGDISTYDHSVNVLNVAYAWAKRYKFTDEQIHNIIVGAMLHDFYLYDWHTGRIRSDGIHGFIHPKKALKNANKLFKLNAKQKNIIKSHMFPMTLLSAPKCKEAWVVMMADKYCAIIEYWAIHVLRKKVKLRHLDLEV